MITSAQDDHSRTMDGDLLQSDDPDNDQIDLNDEPSSWKRAKPIVIGVSSVVVIVVAWQLVTTFAKINPIFLPSPTAVARSARQYVGSGQIWPDLVTTGRELGYGYCIAVALGVSIGLLAGWYRYFGLAITPYLSFFLSVPIIAVTPLIIIWVGVGLDAKIVVVALAASFPIAINTMSGVRHLDPKLIRLERSYCATGLQLFRTLAVPGSVPFILAGMRLGIGYAIAGTYVAEISTSALNGVGLMMANAGEAFETARVFVGLIIFGVAGIILAALLGAFQNRTRSRRGLLD